MSDDPAIVQIARQFARLSRETRTLARAAQGARRSVEITDGTVSYFDDDGNERLQVGLQDDGTFAIIGANGETPPTPTEPDVTPTNGGLIIAWDGTFEEANWPADLVRVEVHVGDSAGFAATDATQVASFVSQTGGSFYHPLNISDGPRWVALVAMNTSGLESEKSIEVEAEGLSMPGESDGIAPPQVTGVVAIDGIGTVFIKWTPVVNLDFVEYSIHASPTTPFTADASNEIGRLAGWMFVARMFEDETTLPYGTDSYFRVVAHDADGAGVESAIVAGQPLKIATVDVGAGAITANEIAANSITSSHIAANTIVAGDIAANTITAGQIAANTITANEIAANTITANEIDAGTITTAELDADAINGMTITGAVFQTAASNERIVIDSIAHHERISLIPDNGETAPGMLSINSAGQVTLDAPDYTGSPGASILFDNDGISENSLTLTADMIYTDGPLSIDGTDPIEGFSRGTFNDTTNSSGEITVSHGCVSTPAAVVAMQGTSGQVMRPLFGGATSSTFTLIFRRTDTNALAPNGTAVTGRWIAFS